MIIHCIIQMEILKNLSKTELFSKCKELNIKKYSKLNKDELIKQIEEKMSCQEGSLTPSHTVSKELSNTFVSQSVLNPNIEIKLMEGLEYLKTITNNSIDLILTDPPYIISKDSGMNDHYNNVKSNEENNVQYVKTEDEWKLYKTENNIETDENKTNFMKYGSIYGKKYCVKTDYGEWDTNFTMEKLDEFIGEYYKKLRKGGTLIIFFDLWKITTLKEMMEKHKFKQIRFIEWIKTNPQPRNSNINYLTNCREIALLGVKDGNPTFHSSYDNGIYNFPFYSGKNRFHPTQKSLILFEELIKKHSNENDTVLDTFLGAGTTAIACKKTNRKFKGCEVAKEYFDKIII